jgi:protein-tyrosine phosphatase
MNPYWIEAGEWRLAILARPRGNDWLPDDMAAARRAGVDVIVSALTGLEAEELGLNEERQYCALSGIEYLSFPIEDRSLPDGVDALYGFLQGLLSKLEDGKSVAVHCRAGIGRSSMLCACLLSIQGLSADSAFQRIRTARGCDVPDTPEQRKWVESFAARANPK